MPSRLATIRPPRFGDRPKLTGALAAELHEETIRGPWPGYLPDIEPTMLPYSAMVGASFGLLARGEILVPDVGWARVDGAHLPLGDTGAGIGTVSASNPQPIQHLGYFNRQPTSDAEVVAITQDTNSFGAEISHVFRLDSTVAWQSVPPRNGYLGPPTYTPWSLGADDFVDDATMPIGFNLTGTGHYASAAGRGVVGQPIYFFVNENNNVACWPCYRAGVKTEYDYPVEAIGAIASFKAATCAAHEGRMVFGNVTYGGATYAQRLVFSAIGDGAAIDPGVVGAGFIDASEMSGRMLRVLRLGDNLIGYFESGIVAYTRTYNPLAPYSLSYLTQQVNALSRRSVCVIDRDRNFVIAEQGWFLVSSDGGLSELGIVSQGGTDIRKWQDTFYASVNLNKKQHISCVYDAVHHLVEISFPSASSDVADTSWLYDTLGDRVFPAASYGTQAIQSQLVAPNVVSAAVTIGSLPGTIGGLLGTIGSYAARLGFQSRWHGDRDGFVYVRSEGKGFAREDPTGTDVQPGYSFVSPQRAVVAPAEWAEARRFEVEHTNVAGPSATLMVDVDGRTAAGVRSLQVGAAGKAGVAFLPLANLGGTHHQVSVAGTAPVALRGMRYVVVPGKGERKGSL